MNGTLVTVADLDLPVQRSLVPRPWGTEGGCCMAHDGTACEHHRPGVQEIHERMSRTRSAGTSAGASTPAKPPGASGKPRRGAVRPPAGAPGHRKDVASPASRPGDRIRSASRRLRRLPRGRLAAGAFGVLVLALTLPSLVPGGSTGAQRTNPAGVGFEDFSFAANGVKAPTGRKPEAAKLWFADGSWWGDLFRPSRDAYTINRFEPATQDWIDTGAIIDDRNVTRADVLWDGEHTYAITGGTDPLSDKHAAVLDRFSYHSVTRTFTMDEGFPIRITDGGSETFVLARADDGQLWVAYTNQRAVYVTHSLGNDREWTRPFPIPVPQAASLTADDVAAVIAYEGHIGVMWSDQADGAMYFAEHANGAPDDAWSVSTAIQGPGLADDHLNLKTLQRDPAGLIFAVVKTSRNDSPDATPDDPLIVLLVLTRSGVWEQHVVGTVEDDATRPLLLIDTDQRMLHVFFSSPCCSGGTIYTKSSSLDRIAFPPGPGTPFMQSTTNRLNNPASTKQNVSAATGLLVIASDDRNDRYMHNFLPLTGSPTAQPSPAPPLAPASSRPGQASAPATIGTRAFADDFEAGDLAAWTRVAAGPASLATVDPTSGRQGQAAAHLVAGDEPAAYAIARMTLPAPQTALAVDLDVKIRRAGPPGGNVPLLRLFEADGKRLLSIYRQNEPQGRLWVGQPTGRAATFARLDLDTWGHVAVEIRAPESAGDRRIAVRLDGQLVAEVPDTSGGRPIASIQIGNESPGQPFDIFVDDVRVAR